MKIITTTTTVSVDARSSPHGFWRFSADYLLAARTVDVKVAEQHLLFPVLQLYGISIELSLKAFLLKRGLKLDQMKKLSHSLSAALALARKRKLGRSVKLDRREVAAIGLLDITYSTHQLRYIVTGSTHIPQLVYVARAAEGLVLGLEHLCTGQSGRLRHAL